METITPTPPPATSNKLIDELKTWATSENEKAKTPPPPASKTGETTIEPGSKIIDDNNFLNTGGHTQTPVIGDPSKPQATQAVTQSAQTTKKILASSGKFAATLIHEMAIPALMVWLLGRFKKTVNKDGFKINASEKEILTEAWNEYLASLNISIDKPIYQLLLAIGFVYGSKFADGSIKIEDMKAKETVTSILKKESDKKVTKENFDDVLTEAKEQLINETRARIRKNRTVSLKHLNESGAFKRLEKQLREKYNIPA